LSVRLFVALEISPAIRDHLAALLNELRALESKSSAKKPRWVRAENLHVTLKFIGHIEPARLDPICARLAKVRSEAPLDLRFRGLGLFPNAERPRVLWAGIAASESLTSLAGDVAATLATLGIPAEERAFSPHLTLARCEPSGISAALRAALDRDSARAFGELRTDRFHLIESKLKPSGAEYTTLQSFVFTAEA
jgi:RNA 2',3'-cyclic 3'-phosphodiesterase